MLFEVFALCFLPDLFVIMITSMKVIVFWGPVHLDARSLERLCTDCGGIFWKGWAWPLKEVIRFWW